jgi:hypothetical protein
MRARAAACLVLAALCAAVAAFAPADASSVPRRGFLPWLATQKLQSASIWAVGDAADGSSQAQVLADRVVRAKPAVFLYLGDVYPDGTLSEFRTHYAPLYGRLARVTAPTPGNHDARNYASGYVRYWHDVLRGPVPAFYSFRVAGWQILSLDSELRHDPASPQVQWLRRQVRAPGTCRIAFWHRPRYSAGTHHGDQLDVAPFWDVLAQHAVLVLNGHEHDLQRLAPRDGITELVAGAGGSELYPLRSGYKGLVFGDDHDQGALHLELTAGSARFSFVLADGRVVGAGAVRCRH